MKFPSTTATQQKLDSGLNVISHVDHAHPLICFQIWVETGSMHELPSPGAGLSHLLEHMVFKGTKSFSGEELMSRVDDLGGSWNAYTTYDRTVYYLEGPSEAAGEFLKLLFELVYLPTLPESDYEMEKEVIRREIAMGNDDPNSVGWQALMEDVYPSGMKRFPIIGDLDRFNDITHEEMVQYHEGRYTFDNSFVVLSGDIDLDAIVSQLTELQKDVAPRRLHEIGLPLEKPLVAPVKAAREFPLPSCKVNVVWDAPEVGHPDLVALEILSTVVGGARSSTLFQTLREKEMLAMSLSSWVWTPKLGKGFFSVSMECEPEKFHDLHTRLYDLIDNLDFSEMEQPLQRAKKQTLMSQLGTLMTVSDRASDLGSNWFEARNIDYTKYFLEKVSEVTVEDLERVAKRYLIAKSTVSSALVPEEFDPYKDVQSSDNADEIIPELSKLSSGMPFITGIDKKLPTVSFQLIYKGGIRIEKEELEGIGSLYSSVLGKGTKKRSAEEFTLAIDQLGASLSFSGGNNTFIVSGFCLEGDLEELCELVSEALNEPLLGNEDVEKERAHLLSKIRESALDPVRLAFWHSRRELFGDSPYRFSRLGSEETMQNITVADIEAYHQDLIKDGEAVLSVFGDLSEKHLTIFEDAFGKLPYKQKQEGKTELSFGVGRNDHQLDKEQAVIVVAYPTASVSCDDVHVLEILQEYFSGMAGPLFVELREKLGLAYFVSCTQFLGIETGMFSFYIGTDPKRKEEALSEMQKLVAKIVQEGLTEEDLATVKKGISTSNARADQTHLNQARAHGLNVLFGKGVEYREEVRQMITETSVEEVSNCLKKYFSDRTPVITVVSP